MGDSAESLRNPLSIQEEPVSSVSHHPVQADLQIVPSDCATLFDGPLMRLDGVQLQPLKLVNVIPALRLST